MLPAGDCWRSRPLDYADVLNTLLLRTNTFLAARPRLCGRGLPRVGVYRDDRVQEHVRRRDVAADCASATALASSRITCSAIAEVTAARPSVYHACALNRSVSSRSWMLELETAPPGCDYRGVPRLRSSPQRRRRPAGRQPLHPRPPGRRQGAPWWSAPSFARWECRGSTLAARCARDRPAHSRPATTRLRGCAAVRLAVAPRPARSSDGSRADVRHCRRRLGVAGQSGAPDKHARPLESPRSGCRWTLVNRVEPCLPRPSAAVDHRSKPGGATSRSSHATAPLLSR